MLLAKTVLKFLDATVRQVFAQAQYAALSWGRRASV